MNSACVAHTAAAQLPRPSAPPARSLGVPLSRSYAATRQSSLQGMALSARTSAASSVFVRPDVPPPEGASQQADAQQASKDGYKSVQNPKFRSALEQVSFMTNAKLQESLKQTPSRPLLGLLGF